LLGIPSSPVLPLPPVLEPPVLEPPLLLLEETGDDRTHDGKERYRGVEKKEAEEEERWKWGSWVVGVEELLEVGLVRERMDDGVCLEEWVVDVCVLMLRVVGLFGGSRRVGC
jgi:hypothetical protein